MLYNIPSDVNPIIGGWVDVNAIVRIFLSIKFFRTDPNVHCSYTLNVRNYEKISSYTRTSRVEKSVERELTFLYFYLQTGAAQPVHWLIYASASVFPLFHIILMKK